VWPSCSRRHVLRIHSLRWARGPALARWGQLGVLLCSAALLTARVRAATPQQRRLLGPLYGYGVLTMLTLELAANVLPGLIGAGVLTVFAIQIIALAGVPVMFLSTLLRGGFARSGTLDELGRWLAASGAERSRLRETLADILGDPQLELLFRRDGSDGYVRGDGGAAEAPAETSGRAAVAIEHAGERIGLIVYDAAVISDTEWVRAAGRVIAIAFERERLTAELFASRESLQESRERIVAVQDRERRRIARELHDRLQGRLVAVAIEAGRIANRPDIGAHRDAVLRVRDDLERSLGELREIVQDITPALLLERGLFSATRELVGSLPIHATLSEVGDDQHLADQVASTGYAFVSETLTNVMKHAQADQVEVGLHCDPTHLRIEISDDGVGGAVVQAASGLAGIVDRLDALNGRLELESSPGAGTTVRVEVPCAS
jgi:signal transduction histidine kinase